MYKSFKHEKQIYCEILITPSHFLDSANYIWEEEKKQTSNLHNIYGSTF